MEADFFLACADGNLEKVQTLLRTNNDLVSCANKLEWTGLHKAAQSGHWDVASLLIQAGSDINGENIDCMTPLMLSLKHHRLRFARNLLGFKPSLNIDNFDGVQAIHFACVTKDAELLQILIEQGADVNASSTDGTTPLILCARDADAASVRLLLIYKADVEAEDERGWRAVHEAACSKAVDIMRILIDDGATVACMNSDGNTPLHLAVSMGDIAVVELLLEKIHDVDCRNKRGWTPLHFACDSGDLKLVTALVLHGAAIESLTENSFTPLYLASQSGQEECLSYLITEKADVNHPGRQGMTPLHAAACFAHVNVVERLLATGHVRVNARTSYGCTPLMLAVQCQETEIVRCLLVAGALNAAKDKGWTPLHAACLIKPDREDDPRCAAITELLLKYGAVVDYKSEHGRTPLFVACRTGCPSCVKLLLNSGGDPRQADSSGQSSLHVAGFHGNVDVIKLLIDHPLVDVTERDTDGKSPLDLAADQKHDESASLLRRRKIRNLMSRGLSVPRKLASSAHDLLNLRRTKLKAKRQQKSKNIADMPHPLQTLTGISADLEELRDRTNHLQIFYKGTTDTIYNTMPKQFEHQLSHISMEGYSWCPSEIAECQEYYVSMDSIAHLSSKGITSLQTLKLLDPLLNPERRPPAIDDVIKELPLVQRMALSYMVSRVCLTEAPAPPREIFGSAMADPWISVAMHDRLKSLLDRSPSLEILKKRMYFYGALSDVNMNSITSTDALLAALSGKPNIVLRMLMMSLKDIGFQNISDEILTKADAELHQEGARKPEAAAATAATPEFLTPPSHHADRMNAEGDSPLHLACREKDYAKIKSLVNLGADPQCTNARNHSPIYEICNHDKKAATRLRKALLPPTGNVNTMMVQSFHQAIRDEDDGVFNNLLWLGFDVNTPDSEGYTALHKVAELESVQKALEMTRRLLSLRAQVDVKRNQGATPLLDVCSMPRRQDPVDIAQALIGAGASVKVTDSAGVTPLHKACGKGHQHTAYCLMEKRASVNAADSLGNTPFHAAAGQENVEILQMLLHHGGEFRKPNLDGETLLHVVCKGDGDRISHAKILVQHGFLLDVTDERKRTPVHYAVVKGNHKIANYFAEIENQEGNTPLHLAAMSGDVETVHFMLMKATKSGDLSQYQNKKLFTPFHCACQEGKEAILRKFMMKYESFNEELQSGMTGFLLLCCKGNASSVELALKHGADITALDNSGRSALHFACNSGNIEALNTLIKHGIDVNHRDNSGRSAIYEAVCVGNEEIIKSLISADAQTRGHFEDNEKSTLLHKASANGNSNIMKLLIEKGCDINAKNAYGETPLSLTVEAEAADLTLLLLLKGCSFRNAFPENVSKAEVRLLLLWAGSRAHEAIGNITVMYTVEEVCFHAEIFAANNPIRIYCAKGYQEIMKVMSGSSTDLIQQMSKLRKSLEHHRNTFPSLVNIVRSKIRQEWGGDVSILRLYHPLKTLCPKLLDFIFLTNDGVDNLSEHKDDIIDQLDLTSQYTSQYGRRLENKDVAPRRSGQKKRLAKLGKKYAKRLSIQGRKDKSHYGNQGIYGYLLEAVSWTTVSHSPRWMMDGLVDICFYLPREIRVKGSYFDSIQGEMAAIHEAILMQPKRKMEEDSQRIIEILSKLYQNFLTLLNDDMERSIASSTNAESESSDDESSQMNWSLERCGSWPLQNKILEFDEFDFMMVTKCEDIAVSRPDQQSLEYQVSIPAEHMHQLSLHLRDYLCRGLKYYFKYDSKPDSPAPGDVYMRNVTAHIKQPGISVRLGWTCEEGHTHEITTDITPVVEVGSERVWNSISPPWYAANSFYKRVREQTETHLLSVIPSSSHEVQLVNDVVKSNWVACFERMKPAIFAELDRIHPNIRRVFHLIKYFRSFLPMSQRYSENDSSVHGCWKDGALISSYILYNLLLQQVILQPSTSDWDDVNAVDRLRCLLRSVSSKIYVEFFTGTRQICYHLQDLNDYQQLNFSSIIDTQLSIYEGFLEQLGDDYGTESAWTSSVDHNNSSEDQEVCVIRMIPTEDKERDPISYHVVPESRLRHDSAGVREELGMGQRDNIYYYKLPPLLHTTQFKFYNACVNVVLGKFEKGRHII